MFTDGGQAEPSWAQMNVLLLNSVLRFTQTSERQLHSARFCREWPYPVILGQITK